MNAIQVAKCGGPSELKLVTLPNIPVPKAGEILVKNKFIGINYIDTYHRTGLYPLALPFIPGREAAGVVDAVGPDVKGFKVGDRVAYITPGTYSSHTLASVDKSILLPAEISFKVGAASLLAGNTALMLTQETYKVKAGDYVLIHAIAGGVGQILCQMCKALGATVIGTTSTPAKVEIAKKLGADHVINYTQTDKLVDEIKKLSGGLGVHVVYDGVGKTTFDDSLASLRPHGWMISYGNASGKPDLFDVLRLAKGSLKLMRPVLFDFIATKEDFTRLSTRLLHDFILPGKVTIEIYKTYPLKDAQQAHIDLEGRVSTGKLVLEVPE